MRPAMWGRFMRPGFFKPLLVAAFVPCWRPAPAEARAARPPEPALWELSAGKSKVYLFGSIHMLPRDWAWRTKAIDAAILSSSVFVFEVAMTQDQNEQDDACLSKTTGSCRAARRSRACCRRGVSRTSRRHLRDASRPSRRSTRCDPGSRRWCWPTSRSRMDRVAPSPKRAWTTRSSRRRGSDGKPSVISRPPKASSRC